MAEHRHAYGWSERKHLDTGDGVESFDHDHERGDEPHEHVLHDGNPPRAKRTTWAAS